MISTIHDRFSLASFRQNPTETLKQFLAFQIAVFKFVEYVWPYVFECVESIYEFGSTNWTSQNLDSKKKIIEFQPNSSENQSRTTFLNFFSGNCFDSLLHIESYNQPLKEVARTFNNVSKYTTFSCVLNQNTQPVTTSANRRIKTSTPHNQSIFVMVGSS